MFQGGFFWSLGGKWMDILRLQSCYFTIFPKGWLRSDAIFSMVMIAGVWSSKKCWIVPEKHKEKMLSFLPQSWNWKITPNERKLLSEGHIFHFHDYGRKSGNHLNWEFLNQSLFFVLFKCFAGLVLWLTIGTSFWRAATRPTKKALVDLSSELSFCGCQKIKPIGRSNDGGPTMARKPGGSFFAWKIEKMVIFWESKIGWWIRIKKPETIGFSEPACLDALDKRIMESPENSCVFAWNLYYDGFSSWKAEMVVSPNKSVL